MDEPPPPPDGEDPPPPPDGEDPPPPPDGEDPPPPPDGELPIGTCVSLLGECSMEEEGGVCLEKGQCVEGACISLGAECTGPAECGDNRESLCLAFDGQCETQDQCKEGFECRGGNCLMPLFGGEPPPMCPPDMPECAEEFPPFCMTSMECGGEECVDGLCDFRDGPPCEGEECESGAGGDGSDDGTDAKSDDADDTADDEAEGAKDMLDDAAESKPLACSVGLGQSSSLGGLGLLMALSTLIIRRRRA